MTATTTPRFDQLGALGWQDRALDGLNCVLRCVESVLHFRGLDPLAVARALNGPVDPVGRDLAKDFDGCRVDYRTEFDDGGRNVPFVLERLGAGEPVMVLPDRFHLPGDVYEGRFHFHDHAVLAVDWASRDSVMTVLDTDADPADGFHAALDADARAAGPVHLGGHGHRHRRAGPPGPAGVLRRAAAPRHGAALGGRGRPRRPPRRAHRGRAERGDGQSPARPGPRRHPAPAVHLRQRARRGPRTRRTARPANGVDRRPQGRARRPGARQAAGHRADRGAREAGPPRGVSARPGAGPSAAHRARPAARGPGRRGRPGGPADPGAPARLRARFAQIESTCFPVREEAAP